MTGKPFADSSSRIAEKGDAKGKAYVDDNDFPFANLDTGLYVWGLMQNP